MSDNRTEEERFKPRPGKRISAGLSIRHARTYRPPGSSLMMTWWGQLIPLSMEEAKRLRAWLDGVIP